EKETWERVQEMLKLNKRAPAHREDKEDYILTGKLFCGKCGKMMIGISGRGKNGAKHCYYACSGKDRRRRTTTSCDKKNVRKEWIEEMVIKSIQDTLKDPAMVEEIAAKTFAYYLEERKDNSYLESLEKRKK